MTTAIAIFAKTPGVSPAKTRLAQTIGKEYAEAFYCLCIDVVDQMLGELTSVDEDITPVWSLAEEVPDPFWAGRKVLWTGNGTLGDRLHHVVNCLQKTHDQVIVIGSDIPEISSKVILKAIAALEEKPNRCVIGPGKDGGFYLFGTTTSFPKNIWTCVTYSDSNTRDQLLSNISQAGYETKHLDELADVDTFEDFQQVSKSFQLSKEVLTPNQRALSEWMKQLVHAHLHLNSISSI